MYPTVVVVLVETQRSITDIWEFTSSNASGIVGPVASDARSATLGHLSFAAGPIYSTVDNELDSQHSLTLHSQDGREHGLEKVILDVKESRAGTKSG